MWMARRIPGVRSASLDCARLTIGEFEGFARLGGMVELSVKRRRIRITVNPRATRDVGISSDLLALSRVIGFYNLDDQEVTKLQLAKGAPR